MKKEIHPEYIDCTVTCACGNTFTTKSNKSEIRVDICANCHPFFTGSEKIVDSAGRVEKFKKKYASLNN
ncbi:50S ribosomal protein L31 [Campylobacter sp. faydin G-24]|uniref:Large ribosomal subunit protein bL31 n=1 Tax=Campylobacter anatolicus TaxID=2829105 RepID=A0ABS5HG07_9BACT|nr:50S ribosomal protein L31 [Campylobacter anatolicus]MBR8462341.1 50S ribosomal protein L31 [Campylobacter anatolicus]MBR8463206.1 50S ribosomal protein L31 [Campylobacter anatolicus]MBR8465480.1 50S ribosomal protein L31 [Campylobacter anatolicus]